METNGYRVVYIEQLDVIMDYLKLHGPADIVELGGLVSNYSDVLLWLEKHNLIRKEIKDGKIIYCLFEIQKDEIPKKEVKIKNENGKEKESS